MKGTTGGSPASCEITEIGAVRVRGGQRLGEFQTLVNPGVPIPSFISVLTGISDAMVATAPRLGAALPLALVAAWEVLWHVPGARLESVSRPVDVVAALVTGLRDGSGGGLREPRSQEDQSHDERERPRVDGEAPAAQQIDIAIAAHQAFKFLAVRDARGCQLVLGGDGAQRGHEQVGLHFLGGGQPLAHRREIRGR